MQTVTSMHVSISHLKCVSPFTDWTREANMEGQTAWIFHQHFLHSVHGNPLRNITISVKANVSKYLCTLVCLKYIKFNCAIKIIIDYFTCALIR